MLVFKENNIYDKQVINLVDYLSEGDLLVFNDAKVIKAKLQGVIARNSAILEFNLDQIDENKVWNALCKPAKKVAVNDEIKIAENFSAKVIDKKDDGTILIKFNCDDEEFLDNLQKYGSTPIPPYIKRDEENIDDEKNYQTIYAKNGLAVAAPTAGLHFNELQEKGVNKSFVTLNVGAGTFLPVRSEIIQDHKMHFEFYEISQETADLINKTKKLGKKVVAVGTTSLRVLESCCDEDGVLKAKRTKTDIFIYPPYKFKVIDALMTNFHLPKSTLLMLICAFVSKENAFKIYEHAIKNNYRFYSYGDSSLLIK